MWLVGYALLPVVGLFFWRGGVFPVLPMEWLRVLAIFVLIGVGDFCLDAILGRLMTPQLSPIQAVITLGGPFAFFSTAVLMPATVVAAIAGLARAILLSWMKNA